MAENDPKEPPKNVSPELRREVSRRNLLTRELGKASTRMVKQLPGLAPALGLVFRETPEQRVQQMVENLWQLLMGRLPKPDEGRAGLDLLKNARTPDERADALVDILWALCRTRDFELLNRPHAVLVRGLYRIALDRDPTEDERTAALKVMTEAEAAALRALEEEAAPPAEDPYHSHYHDDEPPAPPSGPPISPDEARLAARSGALEGLFTGLLRNHESVLRKAPEQKVPWAGAARWRARR